MIKNIINSVHQNFVIFSKTPAAIMVIILPISILILLGSIYPVVFVLPQLITLTIIIISFSSVAIQYHEFRETKFFKTNRNSNIPTWMLILGTFIVVLVVSLFMSFTLILLTWFLTNPLQILNQTIDNMNIDSLDEFKPYIDNLAFFTTFSLSNINWFLLIYSVILSIIMTSLFAIMVSQIFKNIKTYSLFAMLYILIFIIFGGVIIPYYIILDSPLLLILQNFIPNIHTNDLILSSLNSETMKLVDSIEIYSNDMLKWMEEIENSSLSQWKYPPTLDNFNLLDITIVFVSIPWAKNFIETLAGFLNQFTNNSINPDSSFLTLFSLLIAKILGENEFDNVFSIFNLLYVSLNDMLSQLFPTYSFSNQILAIKSNLFPYIIILISLPNFILMGGEE